MTGGNMSDKDNIPGDVAPSSPPTAENPGFTAQELMAAIVNELVHSDTIRDQFKNSKVGKALIGLSGILATVLTVGGIWLASYITGLQGHISNQEDKYQNLDNKVQQQEITDQQQEQTDDAARERLRQAILDVQQQRRDNEVATAPAAPTAPSQSTKPAGPLATPTPKSTPKPTPKARPTATPTPQTDFQKLCGSLGLDPNSC